MTELTHAQLRERQLQTLALAKWMKDTTNNLVKPAEDGAKAWLADNDMTPGSKQAAFVNGEEVGTVSRAKVGEKLAIDDEAEFADWLEENGFQPEYEMRLKPQWTTTEFLKGLWETAKKKDGELPAGTVIKETGGFVSIRMSVDQRDALTREIQAAQAVNDALHKLGIEAGNE